jgi:hypothetical protein
MVVDLEKNAFVEIHPIRVWDVEGDSCENFRHSPSAKIPMPNANVINLEDPE